MLFSCKQVIKRYGDRFVLTGVDLDVPEGKYIALMGKSGAGKSTLINIMAGLDRPTTGDVYFRDAKMSRYTEEDASRLRRENFGFIYQNANLIKELTLYENIIMPLVLNRKKFDTREIDRLLSRLDLQEIRNCFPNTLSGGEQQRGAIARALVHNPQVIFADEPTGNLDEENTRAFLNILGEMRSIFIVTIILVTHDPYVAKCADEIVRISDGKIIREGKE
jgi:ABC-type lipoprotein export system ATPase subunit